MRLNKTQLNKTPLNKVMHIEVSAEGRDEMSLRLELTAAGEIARAELTAIGCPELLSLLGPLRAQLKGDLQSLGLPAGRGHAAMLARELILRAQGKWQTSEADDHELCHCRSVPRARVDRAILAGAHTPELVSQLTSASTGCGTCRPAVAELLNQRLSQSEKV